jgi:hypothetical protein
MAFQTRPCLETRQHGYWGALGQRCNSGPGRLAPVRAQASAFATGRLGGATAATRGWRKSTATAQEGQGGEPRRREQIGGVRVKFTAFGLEVKHEKHPSDHRSVGRYLYAGNSADSQSHGPIQCSARTNAKSKRSPRECAGPYKSLRTRRRTDSLHNRTVCAPIAIGCHNWNCRFCWHGRRELA